VPGFKKNDMVLVLAVFALTFWLQYVWVQTTTVANIPYSEFQRLVNEKSIDNLVISDRYIRGDFKNPRTDQKKQFITPRLETDIAKEFLGTGIVYTREVESNILRDILSWTLPTLFLIAFWLYFSRKMYEKGGVGGLMSVGKSKAKLYAEKDVKVTFEDVAGVDEAKEELKEVIDFLKNPKDFERLGARMPKGILLIGPPGTGKTLLAKAVAGEAHVTFFSISGSEFVELFVGVGAARVRDLFEQARSHAPCIIFIDELDALGRIRAPGISSGGHDEKEQTLNQLLSELDGFDTRDGVILLAATNRPEILDPALLRAGRFDRQGLVDRPDKKGREAILNVHLKKITGDKNLNREHIAALTSGFTGADIGNLVNEAALAAIRRKSATVEESDFVIAIERIVAGLEKKNRILSPKEKKMVAYHEMGHALVSGALPGSDKIQKVSIIPRGLGALGYTIQRPTEDRYMITKKELINKMCILLGGRVAEDLIFQEISTGAADDLAKVTNIAEALVTRYGMSTSLGNIVFEQPQATFIDSPFYQSISRFRSEESSTLIDSEIKNFIQGSTQISRTILQQNFEILEKGALLLIEKETLVEAEIRELFSTIKIYENNKKELNLSHNKDASPLYPTTDHSL
jgi:cell division protease FtsH